MANTTLRLPYTRFVRQVTVGPGANTQFVSLMAIAFEKLQNAQWNQASAEPSNVALPFNDPLTFGLDDRYDCFKASKTERGAGTQTCNLGMVAYRYKMPASASGIPAIGIKFNVTADKFAYSGIKIAVVYSNSASPPMDWELLRKGGEDTVVDTTNSFATYFALPETVGVLNSKAHGSVTDAINQVGDFTLDLSSIASAYQYIYIVLSMYDYKDYRTTRQYWIEGAGMLNANFTEIEFDTEDALELDAGDKWVAITRDTTSMVDIVDQRLQNWSQCFITNNGVCLKGVEDTDTVLSKVGSLLYSFGSELTTLAPAIAIGGSVSSGAYIRINDVTEIELVSSVRFFSCQPLRNKISKLNFDTDIIAPPNGMKVSCALYLINNFVDVVPFPELAKSTYQDVKFWNGNATTIDFAGSKRYASKKLYSVATDATIMGTTGIDVNIPASSTPMLFCLCVSVYDFQSLAELEPFVEYGSELAVNKLELLV